MPSMGNSHSQPDDGSEDHEKYTNADQAHDGDIDNVPHLVKPHGSGDGLTAAGDPLTGESRKKRKKKRSKDVKSPTADTALDVVKEEAITTVEVPAATTTIAVAGEKPRRKKKNRQTSQEEESAQALLALNKGLPAEVPAINEKDITVDDAVESHVSPEPSQAADQDAEFSLKKKKKSKHHKKKKSKHYPLPHSDLQDQEHIQGHDAQIPISPSPVSVDPLHQFDHDATLQHTISHQHQNLEHEIPDSDRIISQHLAAHMSKHAPPPASVPDLQDVLMENNLHFPNSLDGDVSAEHMLEHELTTPATPIPRKTKSGKNTYKRKRAAEVDDANKLVDPALRELDEAAAAAAAAAAATSLDIFDPSEPDSYKSKKKRRLPTEQVLSPPSNAPQKRASRSRKPPVSASSHIAAPSVSTGAGGTFTLEERHAIDTHLHGYMALHALSHSDLCTRVWSNDRKKDDFWESVCSVLPQRSRASIYKHVRRSYHVFQQRAKWTTGEDEELARQVAEKGSSWKDVGDAMGRMGEDCRDRWRNYVKCGEGRGRDRWGEEEEDELRRVLKEVLSGIRAQRAAGGNGAEAMPGDIEEVDLDQPGDISGEEDINWTSISELMGNKRSRIQCRYKWNKMKQQKARLLSNSVTATPTAKAPGWRKRKLRVAIEDMLVGDKLWLLTCIRDSGAREERSIDWDSIAEPDSIWVARDLEKAYKTLRASQPHRRLPLAEVVARLIAELEALPEEVKRMRFQPDAEVEAGQQSGYEDTIYSGNYLSHAGVQVHNPAPVATMGIAGQYVQHELEGMAMVDPALIGQGEVVQGGGHGIQQELEKTAGEAILIAQAAAVAAANAEKGRMEGEQRMEEQAVPLEMEGETERELRRRLGV